MGGAYAANAEQESGRQFSSELTGRDAEITASAELWNALYERHARTKIAMADLARTREQLIELIDLVAAENQ